ncbi:hypothetical protein [Bradyrhizobium cenepequi]|uniref:hypothetical protein n=1 Tax=Bradyrhizobium cenepequi TaxID=2821403 RepID=UPI001CE30550|nr:hypothetical protein [Bradyrhizobium cenepequi]
MVEEAIHKVARCKITQSFDFARREHTARDLLHVCPLANALDIHADRLMSGNYARHASISVGKAEMDRFRSCAGGDKRPTKTIGRERPGGRHNLRHEIRQREAQQPMRKDIFPLVAPMDEACSTLSFHRRQRCQAHFIGLRRIDDVE